MLLLLVVIIAVVVVVHVVVVVYPRNLHLKFGQNWVSNNWEIADIEFRVGGGGGVNSFSCQTQLLSWFVTIDCHVYSGNRKEHCYQWEEWTFLITLFKSAKIIKIWRICETSCKHWYQLWNLSIRIFFVNIYIGIDIVQWICKLDIV